MLHDHDLTKLVHPRMFAAEVSLFLDPVFPQIDIGGPTESKKRGTG